MKAYFTVVTDPKFLAKVAFDMPWVRRDIEENTAVFLFFYKDRVTYTDNLNIFSDMDKAYSSATQHWLVTNSKFLQLVKGIE